MTAVKQPGRPRTKHLAVPRKPVVIEVYDEIGQLLARYEDVPRNLSVLMVLKRFRIGHDRTVYRTDENGREVIRHGQPACEQPRQV